MFDRNSLSERQLRDQIVSIVQRAREKLPNDPTIADIEEGFKLQIRFGQLPSDKDGAYIESGRKILINENVTSDERRQFTIFHELVHHLIREDQDLYSFLHDAYEDSDTFDKAIELICNLGAAEFLLPRSEVYNLIKSEGFTLNLVPILCDQNSASGPATLIQLIQCAPHQCFGVVCEFGQSPLQKNPNQHTFSQQDSFNHLYILYAMRSPSIVNYSLARWTIIPDDHLLAHAYSRKMNVNGRGNIPFRSGTIWQVPCQVIFFRNNIYGIFNLMPPPDHRQPKLFDI